MRLHKLVRRSFTMVELMAAMAIIAILAGIGVKGMQFANQAAAEGATKASMVKTEIFLENFKKKYGYYPQQSSAGDMDLSSTLVTLLGKGTDDDGNEKDPSEGDVEGLLSILINDYTTVKNSGLLEVTAGEDDNENATIEKISFLDGYGSYLQYKCPGDNKLSSYDLWSEGTDGWSDMTKADNYYDDPNSQGNADNITNWE